MTIRLLCEYGRYPANAIVTLDAGTEAGLIASKRALADTTGGTPFVPVSGAVQSRSGSFTVHTGRAETIVLLEGQSLNAVGAANTVGSIARVDVNGASIGTPQAVSVGAIPTFGPFSGSQRVLISCTTGSIDAAVGDAVLGASKLAMDQSGQQTGWTSPAGILMPFRQNYRRWALIGDSRTDTYWTSSGNKRKSSSHYLNWANAKRNQRIKVVSNVAISGARTDQIFASANMAAHMAVVADVSHIGFPCVNSIAHAIRNDLIGGGVVGYMHPILGRVTVDGNSGTVKVADAVMFDMTSAIQQMLAGGRVVEGMLECGATNFNAAQIAAMHEINERLITYADGFAGWVRFFNANPYLHKTNATAASPSGTSVSTITFKTGFRQSNDTDPTHHSALAGEAVGTPYAAYLDSVFPPVQRYRGRAINSTNVTPGGTVVGSNPNAISTNQMFYNTSATGTVKPYDNGLGGGPVTTWSTGSPPPIGWATQINLTGLTVNGTIMANPSGEGNIYRCVVANSAGTTGQFKLTNLQIEGVPYQPNYDLSWLYVASAQIEVAAGAVGSDVYLQAIFNSNVGASNFSVIRDDMVPSLGGVLPSTAQSLSLETEPGGFTTGSTSKGYIQLAIIADVAGGGSITFDVAIPDLSRVFSL